MVSFNCLNEGEVSLIIFLFEGFSFIFIDFENLEGVWFGSISSMDVFNVYEGLGVYKVIFFFGGMVNIGIEFF